MLNTPHVPLHLQTERDKNEMAANRVAGLGAEPSRFHETSTGIGNAYFGKKADSVLPGQEPPEMETAAAAVEVAGG